MVGVAVKVTFEPAHIVVAVALIFTLTGSSGFTVMVMAFDVAGEPLAHVSDEVSTHVTMLLFASADVVKVELFVPALTPFTFHW